MSIPRAGELCRYTARQHRKAKAGGGGSERAVIEPVASLSAARAWGQRWGACFGRILSSHDAVQQGAAPDAGNCGSNERPGQAER